MQNSQTLLRELCSEAWDQCSFGSAMGVDALHKRCACRRCVVYEDGLQVHG